MHVSDYGAWEFYQAPVQLSTEIHKFRKDVLTTPDDKMKHECNVCGKTFRLAGYLQRHLLFHSGVRPHVCPECGKGYVRVSHMKEHMISKHGIIPQLRSCQKRDW